LFSTQPKWHVITGALCCGKTTLINLLADQGFRTISDAYSAAMKRGQELELDDVVAELIASTGNTPE
jgi:predicted ATPase